MSKAFLATLVLAAVPLEFQEAGHQPLNVYLFGRTGIEELSKSEKKALEKELKPKVKEAEQARKDLEKQLKKQYGKKREGWPVENQEEYRRAEVAEVMARFELEYLGGTQQEVYDSVEDIFRAIEGKGIAREKKLIQRVETQEQAHLVVEILGRREKYKSLLVKDCIIAIKISPGEALRSAPLADISPEKGFGREVRMVHAFREEEPYWIIECVDTGRWSNAANAVAGTINAFIKDNQTVLLIGARSH